MIDKKSVTGVAVLGSLSMAAEIEWILTKERTALGIAKARRDGTKFGRPNKQISRVAVESMLAAGKSQNKIAKELGVAPSLINRRIKEWKR